MRAALIYPHQLFPEHPALSGADVCVLVEEPLLLTQYRFHRQKLILHCASMQHFADRLRRQKRQVRYVECGELDSTGDIAGVLTQLGVQHVQFVDPCDDWLQQRLTAALAAARIDFTVLDDPHFLTPWSVLRRVRRRPQAAVLHRFLRAPAEAAGRAARRARAAHRR